MKIDTKLDCELDVDEEVDMISCKEGMIVGDDRSDRMIGTSQVGKGNDKPPRAAVHATARQSHCLGGTLD